MGRTAAVAVGTGTTGRTAGVAVGAGTLGRTAGVAVGAGTMGRTAAVAVGAATETGEGEDAGDKVGLGVWPGVWRSLGVGDADKAAVALGRAVGARGAIGAGVAVAATAGGVAGAAVAAAVALTVGALGASAGFTNFFGGAFGGGVASALILVRARSAAERSAMAVQPLSTTTSETRSLTLRGRWNPLTLRSKGVLISISSPRTVAARGSAFISE